MFVRRTSTREARIETQEHHVTVDALLANGQVAIYFNLSCSIDKITLAGTRIRFQAFKAYKIEGPTVPPVSQMSVVPGFAQTVKSGFRQLEGIACPRITYERTDSRIGWMDEPSWLDTGRSQKLIGPVRAGRMKRTFGSAEATRRAAAGSTCHNTCSVRFN